MLTIIVANKVELDHSTYVFCVERQIISVQKVLYNHFSLDPFRSYSSVGENMNPTLNEIVI